MLTGATKAAALCHSHLMQGGKAFQVVNPHGVIAVIAAATLLVEGCIAGTNN